MADLSEQESLKLQRQTDKKRECREVKEYKQSGRREREAEGGSTGKHNHLFKTDCVKELLMLVCLFLAESCKTKTGGTVET